MNGPSDPSLSWQNDNILLSLSCLFVVSLTGLIIDDVEETGFLMRGWVSTVNVRRVSVPGAASVWIVWALPPALVHLTQHQLPLPAIA